jgi:hypothetical protein
MHKQTEQNLDKEELTDNTINKSTIITVISVFSISVFIIALFLINKSEWEKKLALAQTNITEPITKIDNKNTKNLQNDNTIVVDKALEEAAKEEENTSFAGANTEKVEELESKIEKLQADLQALQIADSLRMVSFASTQSYKIYGLYREKNTKQEIASIAKKFNIKSEKAIKLAEINGEKAYIIPVKGVHIAKNGDTAFSIARKYYKNEKLAKLIEDFNGEIQAGMLVFLPFQSL